MSSHEHRKLRHARVKEILFEASELGPEARGHFLERACSGDVELCREVESLLSYLEGRAAEEGAGRDRRAAGDRRQRSAASGAESGPARIGPTQSPAQPNDSAGLNGERKRSR